MSTARRMLQLLFVFVASAEARAADFTIDRHVFANGGVIQSENGPLELSGTIGQPCVDEPLSGGTFTLQGGFWYAGQSDTSYVRGDMNCDYAVNNFDIDAFVVALISPANYAEMYPTCRLMNGDVNNDGLVNNFDIDPFVACVINSGCP